MMIRTLTLLAAAGALVACDGGGDPVQQAVRETATTNQSAVTRTTAEVEAADHAAAGHTATTGAGDAVFAASEASMHEKMASASGDTVDQAYVAKMVAHHEGAVEMAEVALRESRDPEIRRMAQVVIDTQTREIAEMKAWRPAVATAP
jgi:uncharacterized protein (DUF305 family)